MENEPSVALGFATFVVLLIIYFSPWLTAQHRRHKQLAAIFMLNLLLGWTFFGWAVAWIWAMTPNVHPKHKPTSDNDPLLAKVEKKRKMQRIDPKGFSA